MWDYNLDRQWKWKRLPQLTVEAAMAAAVTAAAATSAPAAVLPVAPVLPAMGSGNQCSCSGGRRSSGRCRDTRSLVFGLSF